MCDLVNAEQIFNLRVAEQSLNL